MISSDHKSSTLWDFAFKAAIMLPIPEKMLVEQRLATPELSQESMWELYCFCDHPKSSNTTKLQEVSEKDHGITLQKPVHTDKKVLLIQKHNFPERAQKLLETLNEIYVGNSILIQARKKSESRTGYRSSRRSAYTGVSRNGPHWQALIAIRKRKTYIGSYEGEKDAAMAFDFYNILLNSLGARTNLSYTKDQIVEMICNYKNNGEVFKPEQLNFS